ncbi:H-type lectin domain protein (macronuclear) [Tetrahymena thermophila SB210]|uniref:H-type lectin domain protein n=1 Tax=Tetrahymena thermophila (strain SB210) TaxID=312017 RepID=W7XBG5_TETTS|nr:H-type lectin domain protein [Tetrahymena thermophila SB210]EWS71016.1 H-type lectin domain protein [Tetrahymena thermophila SB210]|eukprot:XP_012656457.1 H-type lectin domain protein [Tetrahymena thermophila SB210]
MQMLIKFKLQILIWILTNISITQAQIIYTDEVPFVFYANLQVFPTPSSSLVDYSSKQFKAIPDIIVGIQSYRYSKSTGTSFQLQVSNKSKTSCQISSLDNIGIQELNVSILAIDKTNFPNIQVIEKTSQNIFQGQNSNVLYEEIIEFSSSIQQAKGNKQAIVILNSWISSTTGSTAFSLSINTLIINDQYYKIQIKKKQTSQMITSVTYTIIEYSQDSQNSIYNILSYYDTSLAQIPDIRYQNIFIAFSKFDYLTLIQKDSDPYIELSTYAIQTNGQFSFSYFVKNKSKFSGVTSTAIYFYQKKCLQSNQKLQGNQCINDCINLDPLQPLFCLDCQIGQYFLQDLKICQSIEPSSSYLCYPEKNYQTCVLCNSIQKCVKCQMNLNQLECVLCEQNYYVYKGTCQPSVSSSSSISDTANAAVAISVVSSTQGSNFMFLTLQKLNLLYMINILMTSELTILIDQIKGTNPLSYFQTINIFDKHILIESSQQLANQQITNKEFQTSLLVNGGVSDINLDDNKHVISEINLDNDQL